MSRSQPVSTADELPIAGLELVDAYLWLHGALGLGHAAGGSSMTRGATNGRTGVTVKRKRPR
jgi:hypothetical protein